MDQIARAPAQASKNKWGRAVPRGFAALARELRCHTRDARALKRVNVPATRATLEPSAVKKAASSKVAMTMEFASMIHANARKAGGENSVKKNRKVRTTLPTLDLLRAPT